MGKYFLPAGFKYFLLVFEGCMKKVKKADGLTGMLRTFRELVGDSRKIVFIGCPGWCNPFAEMLAYTLRNTGKEMIFIPNLELSKARRIEITEVGMQLAEPSPLPRADVIVLLGGLTMPEIGVDLEELKEKLRVLSDGSQKIIGVCIGGMFQKAGWDRELPFDHIIDADMSVETYEKNDNSNCGCSPCGL